MVGAAPASKYNDKATTIFISQAKNFSLSPDRIKKLVEKKANINVPLSHPLNSQKMPLFLHCWNFGRYISDSEIDPKTKKITKLPDVVMYNIAIAYSLAKAGADTKVKTADGKNAIAYCIYSNAGDTDEAGIYVCIHAIELLQKLKISINEADNNGNTPLLIAVANRHQLLRGFLVTNKPLPSFPIVKHLVASVADVNAVNSQGVTPLMLAAQTDNLEIVKYLVEHGAKVSTKCKKGKTAIDYANEMKRLLDRSAIIAYLDEKMMDEL